MLFIKANFKSLIPLQRNKSSLRHLSIGACEGLQTIAAAMYERHKLGLRSAIDLLFIRDAAAATTAAGSIYKIDSRVLPIT